MKKTIILILMAAAAITGAEAKSPIRFGVKGGVTAQATNLSSKMKDWTVSSDIGFHLGLQSRVDLGVVTIQPELIYSRTNYTLLEKNSRLSTKARINTWDVPVLVSGKLFNLIRVMAGPVFNLSDDASSSHNTQVAPTRPAVTYMAGIGIDLRKVTLDVRYHGQFAKSTQQVILDLVNSSSPSYPVKAGFNSWQFSIGYLF